MVICAVPRRSITMWEAVTEGNREKTVRMKIPGGWIVKTTMDKDNIAASYAVAMVFVPDPQHDWKIR
jgi:hypothetical protein